MVHWLGNSTLQLSALLIRIVPILCTGFRRKQAIGICLEYLIKQRVMKINADMVTKSDKIQLAM